MFTTYIYNPLLAILVFIYKNLAFGDFGLAIIILTIFIRIVLFPLFYKGTKSQMLMSRLQPHIKKIQKDHKDNKEEQTKKLLALYKEHKINPFSSFLLLLLQIPIIIALYQIFIKELSNSAFDNLYFLGLINLQERVLGLVVLAAVLQYWQGKLSIPKDNPDKENKTTPSSNPLHSMGKTMVYLGPILTLVVLINLPAALALYWAVSTIFSIGQQIYINKRMGVLQ